MNDSKVGSLRPKPSITQLSRAFLRLGLTAFGGPAMIAHIRTMAVERERWLDAETFGKGVALCQMVPGATAMQVAAYVGLKTQGVSGAGASFIGLGLPSFLLMMALAAVYTHTHNLPAVVSAFSGLQAIIVAIIANATMSFGKTTLKGWRTLAIAGSAAVLFGFNVNPVVVILLAALGGVVLIKPQPPNPCCPAQPAPSQPFTRPLLVILAVAASGCLLLSLFNNTLSSLALLLLRIDLLAFGGGFSSVPLMFHETVETRHWVDAQTFMDGMVLGQITPGPIVITATFIGYLLGGILGGIIATISTFLPSFLLMVGVSPYFDRWQGLPSFSKIMGGILGSFVGLLLAVTLRLALSIHWDALHLLLAGGAMIALPLKVDMLWVIAIGAAISVLANI